jgi:hypothetical protein
MDPNFERDQKYEEKLFEKNVVNDIYTFLEKKNNIPNLYRGHSDSSWILQTSIDRWKQELFFSNNKIDSFLFENGKNILKQFNIEYKDNLECLMYLQHHGAPTGLLDFTTNFKTALYFAISEHFYKLTQTEEIESFDIVIYEIDPNIIKKINELVILPESNIPRMKAQNGVLFGFNYKACSTLLKFLNDNFNGKFGTKHFIEIKNRDLIRELFLGLYKTKYNYSTLFPDIEGALKGLKEDYYYQASKNMINSGLYNDKKLEKILHHINLFKN